MTSRYLFLGAPLSKKNIWNAEEHSAKTTSAERAIQDGLINGLWMPQAERTDYRQRKWNVVANIIFSDQVNYYNLTTITLIILLLPIDRFKGLIHSKTALMIWSHNSTTSNKFCFVADFFVIHWSHQVGSVISYTILYQTYANTSVWGDVMIPTMANNPHGGKNQLFSVRLGVVRCCSFDIGMISWKIPRYVTLSCSSPSILHA